MNDILKRKCPICGSLKGERIYPIKMFLPEGNLLPKQYDIVCCDKCGFTFAEMEANQEIYNDYYKKCNVYAESADIKKAGYMLEVHRKRMELFENKIFNNSYILDVGCGSGEFLSCLKEKGYVNLYGLDPSSESVAKLKDKEIIGIQGNIFDVVSENLLHGFDLVISTAVVEHIYDLNLYVEQLKKYMKQGGYLLIDAPAVEGFPRYIYPVANYFNHEHINYFSRESLENLFGIHQLKRVNQNPYIIIGEMDNEKEMGLMGLFCEDYTARRPTFDMTSKECIKEYFSKINDSDKKVMDILQKGKKIIIWGCGSYTIQLIAKNPELFDAVEYFIDTNTIKQRTEIGGKKVYPPEKIFNETSAIFVICSIKNSMEIEHQLLEMKKDCEYYIL